MYQCNLLQSIWRKLLLWNCFCCVYEQNIFELLYNYICFVCSKVNYHSYKPTVALWWIDRFVFLSIESVSGKILNNRIPAAVAYCQEMVPWWSGLSWLQDLHPLFFPGIGLCVVYKTQSSQWRHCFYFYNENTLDMLGWQGYSSTPLTTENRMQAHRKDLRAHKYYC